MAELPLLRRFPALAALPRTMLGHFPTPVQRVTLSDGRLLLLKRDDLSGDMVGGNKLRGLEWLLGGVRAGERIVTVGSRGSTHALATAVHARRVGAHVTVVRWNQVMNPAAVQVDRRLRAAARVMDARFVAAAFTIAAMMRLRGTRWIPAGGASAVAMLGHVNAALELVDQIDAGECELPEVVVVPLGTGGTAAGLALGFRIAGLGIRVDAVRVVPRIVGRRRRVLALADACAALIGKVTGGRVPQVRRTDLLVEDRFYGGAYGRPLPSRSHEEQLLQPLGVRLDDTYGRKAFAAAVDRRHHRALLWLTFDGRVLEEQWEVGSGKDSGEWGVGSGKDSGEWGVGSG